MPMMIRRTFVEDYGILFVSIIMNRRILNEYCQNIIPILIGVVIMLVIACIWVLGTGADEVIDVERLANAIYKSEGGAKAFYGIPEKLHHGDLKEARRICINTINNQIKRHAKDNCGKGFLTCLWHRYSPPQAHPLNQFWLKNVKFFLQQGK